MKKIFFMVVMLCASLHIFAQVQQPRPARPAVVVPPPLSTREVSGVVKDGTGQTVIGATILLSSKSDTIRAASNDDGVFVLHNVKQATFVVTVTSVGYAPYTKRYLMNDVAKRIVLDPIVLKDDSKELNTVNINGTPSIVYKTDTVEYRASDYKVRENSTIDELLKHMEVMEVGSDGSLTHQGQAVTKARLNGKDFGGGDVAQAIQNLPADIVDKIQIVDDYGDQAGRTGIKDGDPTKVLNITTQANKSVATLARITASDGDDGRYDERLSAQRINGNEQLNLIGNFRNTVNGIPSVGITTVGGAAGSGAALGVGSPNGDGGYTTIASPSFSYRNTLSKAVQINTSYRYNNTSSFLPSDSFGDNVALVKDPVTGKLVPAVSYFNNSGIARNKTYGHNFSFELEYTPDSSNFLRVIPTYSYTGTNSSSNSVNVTNGFQNFSQTKNSTSSGTTPTYGLTGLYQYIFKKNHMRNISLQVVLSHSDNQQNSMQTTNIMQLTPVAKDSIPSSLVNQGTITKNYSATLQYVEPLSKTDRFEFNLQTSYRGYINNTVTDTATASHPLVPDATLSNMYNYSFTQTRLAANYTLQRSKVNLSIGVRAIPTHLQGENINNPSLPITDRNDFFLIPLFRFQYQWSRTEQLTINYTGTPSEPTPAEIQPVGNVSNATNTVVGNAQLKPTFSHSIVTRYNNYLANSKVNLSANVNATYYVDQVATNTITGANAKSYTYYTNLSGAESISGNYSISKQLDDRRYNLVLNGSASYNYGLSESYGAETHATTWDVQERFGPRINPNTSIEVNPYVSYEIQRNFSTASPIGIADIHRTALTVEGKFYLLKDRTFTFEYNVNKNYIQGLASNFTSNPFVVNAYIEKEFFKRKNGQLRLTVFDLFNQNNYYNYNVGANGSYTYTQSNLKSRYVFVSFILNLQKFSGTPTRNGRQMNRRGDGSFIVD